MGFFTPPQNGPLERALLVGIKLPGSSLEEEKEHLNELRLLARTAGAEVVGQVIQQKTRIDGSTYIGRGKIEELAELIIRQEANLVIFDHDLSPAQARNVEAILNVNVLDRTELILDIFSRRARTRQARIQVEIAQLKYALPRLRRLWEHLSRQAGGIGTRGPGETQLEVDRRRVREKIGHLEKELEQIDRQVGERRKKRKRAFSVTIVGYTNAGKSTLLNLLAGSRVEESNRLFSTLDSTTRRVRIPEGEKLLLTDTVGFIRKLPAHLVASFRATLLDVEEADLLLHLVDINSPYRDDQIRVVNDVLGEVLGKNSRSSRADPAAATLLVFNQIDRVADQVVIERAGRSYPEAVFVSASTGEGVEALWRAIAAVIEKDTQEADITVSAGNGRIIARIEGQGKVYHRELQGENMVFHVRLKKGDLGRIRKEKGVSVKLR
ncbi:MAG: GTPase HflX [Candidatus Krumholzibacteriota bacterium]|nr:GTPase HflX [Candidatus Krumholzibacteriota bacterium]